ncbi:MAG: protein YgfX [Pseudomonadota bacterium]
MLLKVELTPSRLLQAVVVISHLLALVSLLFTEMSVLLSFGLAAGLVWHFLLARRWYLQPSAILFSDDLIRLYFPDREINVVLERECYCTPWLQMLYFRECVQNAVSIGSAISPIPACRRHGARHCVILLADSCHVTARRRLAVLLRWHRFGLDSHPA